MSTVILQPDPIGGPFVRRRDRERPLPVAGTDSSRPHVDVLDDAEPLSDDQRLLRAMRLGFLIGAPATFLVIAAVSLIAGTSVVEAAAIGGWTGLTSGWYFGGIAFLHPRH